MRKVLISLIFISTLIHSDELHIPELIQFHFYAAQKKVIPGTSAQKAKGHGCSGEIKEVDTIGNLALLSLFYQNGCYTGSTYSHADFPVEQGSFSEMDEKNRFDAYLIHPANRQASKFLASRHGLFYKFPKQNDWAIYRYENKKLVKVASIAKSQIKPNEYTQIEEINASDLSSPTVFIFAEADRRLSSFTQLAPHTEAALVAKTGLANAYKYRYTVAASPANGANSSVARKYFFLKNQKALPDILWQDTKNNKIYITKITADLENQKLVAVSNPDNLELVAATADGQGHYYYLTVQEGSQAKANRKLKAWLYKMSDSGQAIQKQTIDCGPNGFNATAHSGNHVSMAWTNDKLGIIFARTMFRSDDGLNHQGAISAVFDSRNLKLIKNQGQTSGHSFDSYLFADQHNNFVGIDLGDNYPRGINLHRFNESGRQSRVVYTFKTHHGTTARSPAGKIYPKYNEISTPQNTFYKWSNDNGTYTQLGAVLENKNSYTVVFLGRPYKGRALDNSRVGDTDTDSYNLGLLQVVHDFDKASGGGNEVSDDLVLSKGISETGGFFTFGGAWSKQRNTGVVWLTDYTNKQNANFIKAVRLGKDIVILWEQIQEGKPAELMAMKVSNSGEVLEKTVSLGSQFRLSRRDDPYVIDNRIFIAGGDELNQKLELLVLEFK